MGDSTLRKKVVEVLLEREFAPVCGTTEKVGSSEKRVSRGVPLTWDINNGVLVVYDEWGCPWIKRGGIDLSWFSNCSTINMGAYVPHSNDGGKFVNELFEQETKVDEVVRGATLMLAVEKLVGRVTQDTTLANSLLAICKLRNDVAKLYEKAKLVHWAKTDKELSLATEELRSI